MKKIIFGKKIGMSRIFDKDNAAKPVTVIEVDDCTVINSKDGSVQVGYGKAKKISKPIAGHIKKAKLNSVKIIKEFKNFEKEVKIGDKLAIDQFNIGDIVNVRSKSKGKGFTGVIKRHGFSRGPESHGSDHHRAPGSIGGGYPQRVIKGKKMAGRKGGEFITSKNIEIIDILKDKNLIVLKGSIAGPNKTIVEIKN